MNTKPMIAALAVAASLGAFSYADPGDASALAPPRPNVCPEGHIWIQPIVGPGKCVDYRPKPKPKPTTAPAITTAR